MRPTCGLALTLLAEFDCLAFFEVVDFGLQESESVATHKRLQADKLIENLTEEHQPTMIAQLNEMRSTMRGLADPLYAQLRLTTEVIWKAITMAPLFHVFRTPAELGSFHWIVDAKDRDRTEYEELWSLCVLPWLQSRSMKEPFISVEGGDYSHFERFRGTLEKLPDYLKPAKLNHEGPVHYIDARQILMENLCFADSQHDLGLQLVDIVATTLRRALVGNIREDGWQPLAGVLLAQPRGALRLFLFGEADADDTGRAKGVPYSAVMGYLNENARGLLTDVDTSSFEEPSDDE